MSDDGKKRIRAGGRVRVLVVDDSAVARRYISNALGKSRRIEVAGTASNGSTALQKLVQINPDVITLDVDMPGMGGIEMLREMRARYKDSGVRVVMFSSQTARGATAALDALTAGADDYLCKPANEKELIAKVEQFFMFEEPAASRPALAFAPGIHAPRRSGGPPQAVVIGSSTGGPAALGIALPMFPKDFPLPILIVQHMPTLFTRLLATRLDATSSIRVAEAADGDRVEPGKALIAPGDFHMRLVREGAKVCVRLDQGMPENSCRPSVDVLFRSAEQIYNGRVVAAVLTGMGNDGQRGAEALKASGASVIAQDEATSVVWGMPGAVTRAGLADIVLPIEQIVPEILLRTKSASRSMAMAEAI